MIDSNLVSYLEELNFRNYSPKTLISYELDISQFQEFLLLNKLALTLKDANARTSKFYLEYLIDKKLSPTTINRKISSLKNFYEYLYNSEIVKKNIFSSLKVLKTAKKLPNPLSDNELTNLFSSINTNSSLGIRNYLILDLLYSLGLRVSELTSLTLKSINYSRSEILIHGKGNKDRILFIYPELLKEISNYVSLTRVNLLSKSNNLDNEFLLLNRNGTKLSERGVQKILNSLVKSSNESYNIHPHQIRHSFATTLLNNGAKIKSIQEWLGHESISTTQIYTKVATKQLEEELKNHLPKREVQDEKI
ncbi:MAG: tyrosine-type recombinase/integrase [Acholeplasmatales bacterium]|jgi:integrase/recombinase XerC|nr:tyrosine-type recombinase/integrase [Acholeplasmatales bacterium]